MTSVEPKQSTCRFGIAVGDITPPVGIYHRMWGAASHDRSTGVHRPLRATVVIFAQPGSGLSAENLQVVVPLDHCLLEGDEIDRLKSAISNATTIPAEAVVVVFSHTHAAGLMSRDRAGLPGGDLIPPYLDGLQHVVARLAQEALSKLRPATITYGVGSCRLAANRDFRDPQSEQWVCGFNPDRPADDTVVVARVTNASHEVLATLVNYACHPTTLAWQNQLISPDYPGAMREVVEAATGAPCVFLQGAAGDLGPREGFVGDTAVADRHGRELGYAALSALAGLPPPNCRYRYVGPVVSGATLGEWRHETLDAGGWALSSHWRLVRAELPLPYRPELPSLVEVEEQHRRLSRQEAEARAAGRGEQAAELRALLERQTRLRARLGNLPPGEYPYRVVAWGLGNAIWCAVQGEPYSQLQIELRRRFPSTPIVVASLADSWGASYLPPAELYGSGIYQESIAILAPGSLEHVIEKTAQMIGECQP